MFGGDRAVRQAVAFRETGQDAVCVREADWHVREKLRRSRVLDVEWHSPDFELHVGGLS